MILSAKEIEEFRVALKESPEALETLDLVSAMDGNLEGAMGLLAPQYDIEFTRADNESIETIAKRFSKIICDEDFIDDVMSGLLTAAVGALAAAGQIPQAIATPIVLYLAKKGVKKWCALQKDS